MSFVVVISSLIIVMKWLMSPAVTLAPVTGLYAATSDACRLARVPSSFTIEVW